MKTLLFKILISLLWCENICAQRDQKNVVIIVADDLGFYDVSYRGSNEFPTPNIDALAYNGVTLDRFYTAPMCTPSRSSLLTGKYPHHVGMQNFVIVSDEPFGLSVNEKIMPQYFKDAGYSTHLVGKWHLGFYQQQYWPNRRGFDSFYGYLGPFVGYYDYSLEMFTRNYSRGYDMRRNYDVDRSYENDYLTDVLTKETIDIIENYGKENPLFLIVSHLAPHAGNDDEILEAKPEDYAKFSHIENEDRRKLGAMVRSLDESVGDIVEALVKTGKMNDTIIVFLSDNGGPTAFLHATTASNYPLRGQKESPWEGGIRTNALIYAPFLPSGVIRKDLFHITDFLPTLKTLSNAKFKIDHEIDGLDLSKMIIDGTEPHRNEVVFIDDVSGYSSIIFNDYKLVNGSSSNGEADGWLGSNNNSNYNANEYADVVMKSKVAQLLSNFNTKLDIAVVKDLRTNIQVKCSGKKVACDLLKAPCLFHIFNDPCEENNLANSSTQIMKQMTYKLKDKLKNITPSRRKPRDPNCNPANFNFTWSAWQPDSKEDEEFNKSAMNVPKIILIGVSALIGAYSLVTKFT